jgi:hypothetical protein
MRPLKKMQCKGLLGDREEVNEFLDFKGQRQRAHEREGSRGLIGFVGWGREISKEFPRMHFDWRHGGNRVD